MMKAMDEFQATVCTVFARLRSDMESYLDQTYETECDPRVVERIIQNEALSASALTSDQVESLIPTEVYRPPGEEDFGTPPDTPPESVNGECATSPCGDDGGPDPETGDSGLTTAVPETM